MWRGARFRERVASDSEWHTLCPGVCSQALIVSGWHWLCCWLRLWTFLFSFLASRDNAGQWFPLLRVLAHNSSSWLVNPLAVTQPFKNKLTWVNKTLSFPKERFKIYFFWKKNTSNLKITRGTPGSYRFKTGNHWYISALLGWYSGLGWTSSFQRGHLETKNTLFHSVIGKHTALDSAQCLFKCAWCGLPGSTRDFWLPPVLHSRKKLRKAKNWIS